jgi:Flp pilus assembly protein protease CpaA
MLLVNAVAGLLGLVVGSLTDMKSREVPDWLSFSLIFFGFGSAGIYSITSWSYVPMLESAIGFGLFLGLGYLMFYAGQWGGGDSKIVMAMGALIGIPLDNFFNSVFLAFLINIFVVGAIYGLLWSVFLAIRHRKGFVKAFRELSSTKQMVRLRWLVVVLFVFAIIVLFVAPGVLRLMILLVVAVFYVMFYAWLFIKAVEKACMIKKVSPDVLTEGDWIARDVFVGKKRIASPKDLGVSKEQIALLKKLKKQKRISTVWVKYGIPFVPSFLVAFLASVVLKNWVLLLF